MEAAIKVESEVQAENNKLVLKGMGEVDLEIDYTGDVDFTKLVECLTDLIDKNQNIELTIPSGFEEGKISVVLKTVSQIFQKYNDSLTNSTHTGQATLDIEPEEDDLPF